MFNANKSKITSNLITVVLFAPLCLASGRDSQNASERRAEQMRILLQGLVVVVCIEKCWEVCFAFDVLISNIYIHIIINMHAYIYRERERSHKDKLLYYLYLKKHMPCEKQSFFQWISKWQSMQTFPDLFLCVQVLGIPKCQGSLRRLVWNMGNLGMG